MSDVVGSAKFELRASRDKLKTDIEAAERDLKESVGRSERDVKAGAGGMGAALAGVGAVAGGVVTAVTALVAVIGLAVAAGIKLSFEGLRFADDLANSARKINVSTNALQEWQFVARKTGATAKDAETAIDAFATKLSMATAGTNKSAIKAFDLLKVGPEELRAYASTEEALDDITDRIKDLKSEADRAAVTEALGLGPLSNALRDAEVDVAALRDAAHDLGFVMDAELIRRASEAQEKFDDLAFIIDGNLKSAFVDLAPVILNAIQLVARLAADLANALDQFRTLENKTMRGLESERVGMIRERDALVLQYGSEAAARGQRINVTTRPGEEYTSARRTRTSIGGVLLERLRPEVGLLPTARQRNVDAAERIANLNRGINARTAEITSRRIEDAAPARTDRSTGTSLDIPSGPNRKTPVDRSAEREERRAERVQQDLFKARQRLLGIVDEEVLTVQQRYDLEKAQVELEREAEALLLESKHKRGEIKDEEFAQFQLLATQTAALEDRVAADILARDLANERLAKERLIGDLTADLLSLQLGAARTAKERREIELQLLAAAQRRAREDLELDPRFRNLTPEGQTQARAALAQVQDAQTAAVNRANLSPLEQWRDEALKSAAEVSEAFESIAASGLDALNEGLVDAMLGTKSLGEVFSQVAKQILADLLSISVRRGITEPLANALFGGGGTGGTGGGGGGFLSSIGSAIFGGLRGGAGGGGGGFSLPNILGNVLGKITGTSAAPASAGAPVSFDLRGAVMTSDLLKQMQGMASQSGGAALGAAKAVVPADMAQTSRYTRR